MGSFQLDTSSKIFDEKGNVTQLNHVESPFRLKSDATHFHERAGNAVVSARVIADAYLSEALPAFGLNQEMLVATGTDGRARSRNTQSGEQLIFESEKSVMGNSRVTYSQNLDGIPVWESGVVVQVEENPMQVVGSQSTVKKNLKRKSESNKTNFTETHIDSDAIRGIFSIPGRYRIQLHNSKQFVYQYRAKGRLEIHSAGPLGNIAERIPFALPVVADEIGEGESFVVLAVEFTIHSTNRGESSWLALIEPETSSVLMLRSLEGCDREPVMHEIQGAAFDPAAKAKLGGPAANTSLTGLTNATTTTPTVVFFDIGDTLGKAVVSGGQLNKIEIFPSAMEVVKELFEKQLRVGIISDPGPFNPNLIKSLMQDTGIMAFLAQDLLVFGTKNSKVIFENSAALAGVTSDQCLFVGENSSERMFAGDAGFVTVDSPDRAVSVVDPKASLAWVYLKDPKTKLGSAGPGPAGSTQDLDRHRDLVSLVGLTQASFGANQSLDGEFVRLVNVSAPSPAIPSSPVPGDFRFSVTTNDFGAVNAYHNCDRLFRLLEGFGINVKSYFDGTTFPVRVDHRVGFPSANSVNASAPGFSLPPRSDGFRFALAALNTSVGMAADWRVVLHEFGHALLWDNVGSANFKFAHSAGDAMAAILNDAGSQSPRNLTFPWVQIGRSHQRAVSSLAWYGPSYEPFFGNDSAGYVAEQMLSSSLFRIYQAAGGDSDDKKQQDFAAQYVVFLIIKAIGLMSPANNPAKPEGFADLMMQADTGIFKYEGKDTLIGSLRKVTRWAFEMQGAYRTPPGVGQTPINRVGDPPKVDVFINDGRDGNYHFVEGDDSRDVWNRIAGDDGTVHQDPIMGQKNFAYVRVSNRGVSQAMNVKVQGFQSTAIGNALWPDDWNALIDAVKDAPSGIIPGGSVVVGPFQWIPMSSQPTLLMAASADGDGSNLGRFTSANPITSVRLVPLDNNLGTRGMVAVPHLFV